MRPEDDGRVGRDEVLHVRPGSQGPSFLGGDRVIDKIKGWGEELTIRFYWVVHLTHFEKMRYLCPPECYDENLYGENAHTYRWPCKERIRKPKISKVGAWRDDEDPHDPLWDESRAYDDPTEHWSG